MANRVVTQEELTHYGVKGMKWDESKKKKNMSSEGNSPPKYQSGSFDEHGEWHADREKSSIERAIEKSIAEAYRDTPSQEERERREQEFRDHEAEAERLRQQKKAEENRRQLVVLQTKLVNARKKGLSFAVAAIVKAIKAKEAAIDAYEKAFAKHSDSESEKTLKHYNEYPYDSASLSPVIPEVDKSKSISEMTNEELRRLINRLRDERDAEDHIRILRRSAGQPDTFEKPAKVDTTTPVNQLYHWGILGQKWGVRRFQNADGSRTAAGKRREAQMNPERVKKSEDYVKSRESKQKTPAGLSNEELRKLNERLQLEATYKTLTTEKKDAAESWVKNSIQKAAEGALTDFSKGIMLASAKLLVKQLSPNLADAAFGMKQPGAPAQTPATTEKKKKQGG